MVNLSWRIDVNEQKPEPTSAEPAASMPVTAAFDIEAPRLAPEQEETSPQADPPKLEVKVEPKIEAKPEAKIEPKIEAPKVEAVKPEAPHSPGKVVVMPPGGRSWDKQGKNSKAEAEQGSPKRRASAMLAMVALATVAGALGGALATAGLGHWIASDTAAVRRVGLEASVARLDADVLALKANVEQNARAGTSQLNKSSDRLDKVEKAQAEPAAKLAKLSEAVEKLRAAQAAPVASAAPSAAVSLPAAAVTPVAAHAAPAAAKEKEITGSIAPPATAAAAPAASAKVELARLPAVEGWVLRDVGNGGALIESRRGLFEVYAGDAVPGLGRVDAIRRQDGRWVVVTTKGLIVAR
jgi:hypothetical protein